MVLLHSNIAAAQFSTSLSQDVTEQGYTDIWYPGEEHLLMLERESLLLVYD